MSNNFSYYQQSAPFWDWVASLEDQGNNHPFFARGNQQSQAQGSDNGQQHPNPWANGWAGFPFGPMPHRGRHGSHGSHGRHHAGPRHEHKAPPAPPADHDMSDGTTEKERDPEAGSSDPQAAPPPPSDAGSRKRSKSPRHHGSRHGSRHGRSPSPGPGHHGPRHGRSHSPGPKHHGPRHGHSPGPRGRGGRGRGGFGGFGRRGSHGPFGGPAFGPMGGLGELAQMFQSQLFGDNTEPNNTKGTDAKTEDFKPEVDVFDTTDSYVVHISLPGAKKEDVGVNWDADKSELSIAGVVYRPGDEEFLKTLALDERKVGVFDRKVRLGSRANPAQVDVDGISAKMEDGVLRVDVPKQDAEYVEIKKVDIV
ncbi:hypothetical protein LTR91_002349 [Friedmanniomyces endolithicus]|uniref:SHSP domain-containing protein n=1 Tax=Friedmanniomyces endolithicus TaxID=329885 RepID=A0A4V5N6Q4_9PEZI|nr:hypothetical protein LTS09_011010 [Friedmanniomyces endolithicus]KAK0284631.1 hypothetical protein LTR35_005544 [Friedmanniomyces endolithicus]KAK0297573.1 hypothetical protein LTS00_003705 [Friedmanniomyces endolithicus]KAK0322023.1 hypothetical protein LTR82_006997 [Friedmanniomyces endolithicus]KAK0930779.1 hypothetical protein LTR57_001160 [Friedmanniomyces endolithicus]